MENLEYIVWYWNGHDCVVSDMKLNETLGSIWNIGHAIWIYIINDLSCNMTLYTVWIMQINTREVWLNKNKSYLIS